MSTQPVHHKPFLKSLHPHKEELLDAVYITMVIASVAGFAYEWLKR